MATPSTRRIFSFKYPMTTSLDSTVVACTRNRSTFLAEACKTILAVDFPADRWEMLIVAEIALFTEPLRFFDRGT